MAFLPKPSESQGDFVLPDPGMYTVEFTEYEGPQQSNYDPNKQVIYLKFNILNDEEFQGLQIKQLYGWSMHPTMSKLYPVIKALNGGTYDDNAELDIDSLIGRTMLATVEHIEKPSKNNPGDKMTFARITGAAAIRRKKKATPPPPPPVEDEFEDDEEWEEGA